jgi:glutamine synthetase adenylyltransferase
MIHPKKDLLKNVRHTPEYIKLKKRFDALFSIVKRSIWLWYLKMMSPAFLAALMAILSVGCMIKGKNE